MGISVELLRIKAANNEVAALYYAPRRARKVTLIVGHGYSSSKHNLDFLCYFLASHGFAIYSLDFPGHKLGASGGTLRTVDDCIDAMSAVVEFARTDDRTAGSTIHAMGHSMGGMTAIFTAALDPEIAGVIAITTGYGRPTAITSLQQIGVTDLRSSYVDGVSLPDLVAGVDAEYDELLPRLGSRPKLFIAAERDGMVNPASVRELYERAPEPKTFATIASDHTYAGENARSEVLQWLNVLHPRS